MTSYRSYKNWCLSLSNVSAFDMETKPMYIKSTRGLFRVIILPMVGLSVLEPLSGGSPFLLK